MSEQQPAQKFALQRIYVKDCSLESPASPMIFTKQWKPQMQVDINSRSERVGDELCEVILTVTVTAKLEEETVLLIEVQQGGLFTVAGFSDEQLQQVLGIACPNLMFPYVRETVDSLAIKAALPPVNLQPVNFEALFVQAKAEQEKAESTAH